jgi:hypothetical protein
MKTPPKTREAPSGLSAPVPRLARLWALGLALLGACIVFVGPGERNDDLAALVSARARWNALGTSDYEYVLQQKCFCVLGGVPVRVLVRAGAVVSAVRETDGQAIPPELRGGFVPVERLFDVIVDAMDRGAHRIEASYHPQFGYPTDFFIDFSPDVADEEMGYTASALRPLQ